MNDWLERTALLFGDKAVDNLKTKNVLIAGLGGVGAYAAESLCRSGIGKITIVDSDKIVKSNINRQLLALNSTLGKSKTQILKARLLDINPNAEIVVVDKYLDENNIPELIKNQDFDFIVDAIDTISPKFNLIKNAVENNISIVSAMGAGGKTNPTMVKIADISKSYNCKLSRTIRKRLHKVGIYKGFKVVFSPEEINEKSIKFVEEKHKKTTVGTVSYMPAIFGLYCSYVVLNQLINN